MKLYLYDHCPYCLRTEMVAYYKNIHVEKVYLLNDDEQTCFRLVNAKQVPILEFDDGKAIPESLDIAHKFDEMGDADRVMQPSTRADSALQMIATASPHTSCLLYPRNIAAGLPEFATQSAKDYFRHKKEKSINRTFEQAMHETPGHKAAVEIMLTQLAPLLPATGRGALGWDDVMVYPVLRNLTIVKGLKFPDPVLNYISIISQTTGTHTYFDRAL